MCAFNYPTLEENKCKDIQNVEWKDLLPTKLKPETCKI